MSHSQLLCLFSDGFFTLKLSSRRFTLLLLFSILLFLSPSIPQRPRGCAGASSGLASLLLLQRSASISCLLSGLTSFDQRFADSVFHSARRVSMAAESSIQDSRKRTLEALERRFAVAKAELLTQQKKYKTSIKGDGKQHTVSYTSTDSSLLICGSSNTPPLSSSSKKGNFTFSGQASLQGSEEDGPTYEPPSQTVHENLLATKEEFVQFSSGRQSSLSSILHELLQKGDSAPKYMQGSRSMKIDNWILLDHLVQRCGASSGSRTRALQVHSKRSKKHMSMKQHKKHGTLDLPRELWLFDNFRQMHELWKGYMQRLLNATGKNQLAQCLLDADLHGAIILVVECKVTSFTGVCGIVIRETAEAFGIITEDNRFQVVPKKISVFVICVDCWKVTLYGDKLTSRKLGM